MERNIAHIALFAALIAALGLVPKFTLAFGVPITAQSMGVMLCGAVLGARRGALAVLLFLVLVAIGLPLLAGGRGGLGTFATPSVGFLIGWPVAAFVTGLVVEKWRGGIGMVATLGALLGGVLVLYVFGVIGMSYMLKKSLFESLMLVTAFIPGDIVKAFITGAVTAGLARSRPSSILSRS
ncbi:biotin transporter BioY [Microbulbifer sp. S227A]|uniref:biotin transporter BioY n=1 Tax=Microbulbifer sp. S227A TaxID=3415131 RepID=UPI003C7A3216